MSRLDRLQITGMRAFSPAYGNSIQFFTPLTLIVGSNGSGKTTIIECLKYSTTGEMPPNSQGGAFVHDPNLTGDKEVLAQVRLSFVNSEGTIASATRNLQLTVKKNSRSLKQLEGSVKIKKNGETTTLSSRVAEMNSLMPRYLGVSRAVLDNVIFCHQDESLWPLMASKDLKVRFDQIFEASKYTKAIENIKIMQKNKRIELGQLQIHETNAKVNKDRAVKMKAVMSRLQEECDDLRARETELRTQAQDRARLAEEAWHKVGAAELIVGQLRGKRIERDTKAESVQSLRDNLQELSDSDEQLQRMLEQYDERVKESEKDLSEQKQRYVSLQNDINRTRSLGNAKERECGALEEQKKSYDRSIAKRQRLIKETARSHDIRGYDADVDDAQATAFIDKISKMARDQNATFERVRRETQEELQRAQKVLNKIYEKKSALNQTKESARKALTSNDSKISSLQNQLDRITYDEGTTVTLQSKYDDVQSRLEGAKTEANRSTSSGQLGEAEAELHKLEERKETLDQELVEATRRAGDTAQLDIRQKELKDCKRSLDTMESAHGESIEAIVGRNWTPETLERDFQRTVNDRNSAVMQAERQRDGGVAELKQVEFRLNSCRSDLAKKQSALKAAQKAIKDVIDCEPQNYPQAMSEMEQERDDLKSDAASSQRLFDYLEECLKQAKLPPSDDPEVQGPYCRTCLRGLREKEVNALIKSVERERKKLAGNGPNIKDLQECEDALAAARAVSTDVDTWERIKAKEIPALEAEKTLLTEQFSQLNSQVDEYDTIVRDKAAAKQEADGISRNVQKIAKYSADILRLDDDIQDMSIRQNSAGQLRGLEKIQDDSKRVTDEMRAAKSRLARLTGERDRLRNEINAFELECRDIKSKLSSAEFQRKEKVSLEGQVEEYRNMNTDQREAIKTIDTELSGLVPQLSTAQEKYDDVERRGQDKDRELQAVTTKLNSSTNELKSANHDIEAYHESNGPKKLAEGRREVENLKSEVGRIEKEGNQVVQRVKQLEDQLRNHSETKRSVADNQRYRRDLRQLNAVETEIRELEKHDAEEEKAKWERESMKHQAARNKLAGDQATVIGQLQTKDDHLTSTIKDFDTDYRGAAFEYRKSHVMVETTKAAVDDLGRYGGALDKAIMKYHSIKMKEINGIIEDLWRKTYQGTDVDTILIRSESETVRSNKSYNYRVCMVKQDVEMDMRGRCSAGQKVLACIIIRLALAECFGINCGMIALDEPTTNLDTENIRALARSLSEIIKTRRTQRNFQLIVITHDEDFLRQMNCAEYADYYWRVSRDEDQKSKIERNSIAEVMR